MMIKIEKFTQEDFENQDYLSKYSSKDIFNLKTLSKEEKTKFIVYCLKQEGLVNANIIVNLSFLVKSFRELTTQIFEREDIFYNDMIELLDIKEELKPEIDVLRKKIVEYYFSIVKSLRTINEEMSCDMENIYFLLFQCLSMEDISTMMQKVNFSYDKIKLVRNSKSLLKRIMENSDL